MMLKWCNNDNSFLSVPRECYVNTVFLFWVRYTDVQSWLTFRSTHRSSRKERKCNKFGLVGVHSLFYTDDNLLCSFYKKSGYQLCAS